MKGGIERWREIGIAIVIIIQIVRWRGAEKSVRWSRCPRRGGTRGRWQIFRSGSRTKTEIGSIRFARNEVEAIYLEAESVVSGSNNDRLVRDLSSRGLLVCEGREREKVDRRRRQIAEITLDEEKNEVIRPVPVPFVGAACPFVLIDSRETLRRKSIVIERVFDLGSLELFDDEAATFVVAAAAAGEDDFELSEWEFCTRNLGAIKRRRTEPNKELSVWRSEDFDELVWDSSRCCCSTSYSCRYWLWWTMKLINGRLLSCKVRYKFSNKVIFVRS